MLNSISRTCTAGPAWPAFIFEYVDLYGVLSGTQIILTMFLKPHGAITRSKSSSSLAPLRFRIRENVWLRSSRENSGALKIREILFSSSPAAAAPVPVPAAGSDLKILDNDSPLRRMREKEAGPPRRILEVRCLLIK